MKLLFISDNFPPEVNAPATRTYEHCKEWVEAGMDVTVVTCAPNFPDGKVHKGYKNKLISREVIDGIKVIRVWSYISANKKVVKRTLDYVSFAFSSFVVALSIKTDLIVATSPQLFSAISGRWLSFFKRTPWVMEVRDLWPESIKMLGVLRVSFILNFFEWVELRLYKSAKLIISVTDSFKVDMVRRGVPSEKIRVIKNGVNLELYQSREPDALLIRELETSNQFIIGYIGTHGLAHKLDFILQCAAKLRTTEVKFLFIGSGAKKEELVKLSEELKLENVIFLDPIPKKDVSRYISVLDAMVVPLKKSELFKSVIPSKIFETAAMRVPILLGVDGESRSMIETYNAGLYFEPENEEAFFSALETLRNDKAVYKALKDGCSALATNFDRKKLARNMMTELELLV